MAAVQSAKLGPGTFWLGPTAARLNFSCQVQNAQVAWDKSAEDDVTVLCGDVVAGSTTYTSTISGTFLQDLADEEGLVAYSWEHRGEQVEFEFVPNTEAGASVTGMVTVDPVAVGTTDDYGALLTSDFEWNIVGEPTLTFGVVALAATAGAADVDADEPVGAGV